MTNFIGYTETDLAFHSPVRSNLALDHFQLHMSLAQKTLFQHFWAMKRCSTLFFVSFCLKRILKSIKTKTIFNLKNENVKNCAPIFKKKSRSF